MCVADDSFSDSFSFFSVEYFGSEGSSSAVFPGGLLHL